LNTYPMAIAFALVCGLSACGSAARPRQQADVEPKGHAAIADAEKRPTVENILRWATEGEAGWNKIASGLAATFDLKPLPADSLYGKYPVRLLDGRTLSFASISKQAKQIDIGISETPCVSPTWAAAILSAKLDPAYRDAHGVDRGQVYYATVNGMFVRINTTPETYRCVTAMHIYPAD